MTAGPAVVTIGRMKDLSFDDMHLFTRVAELGSLSAVARERDVEVSQVSRTLSRIEKTCGARLIHRSTHGLAPTAEGATFAGYCRRIAGTLDELEGEFASQVREAGGWVRVAASTVIAEYMLMPGFAGLKQRHPRVNIDLRVDDRMVDMAREGIDIAIRTGEPTSDTVVARKIGMLNRRLYAAPAYLRAFGTPGHPDDLHQYPLIGNSAVATLNRWRLKVQGKPAVITVEGSWRCDSTSMTMQFCLHGLGIGRLATLVAEPLVRQGRLVPVLAEFVDEQPVPIHATTLTGRHRLPKIKACIDYWAEWFRKADQA